jgi:mitochondrial chaperone BCS1
MDVWIEFKNASKYQAEHLFRNFFPSSDADAPLNLDSDTELAALDMPALSSPASSQLSSLLSEALSGLSSVSSRSGSVSPLSSPTPAGSRSRRSESVCSRVGAKSEISEISSAVEEHMAACAHVAPPLSAARLAQLAKQFADAIPDEGFSVAALQGCECPIFIRMWLDRRSAVTPLRYNCLLAWVWFPMWCVLDYGGC